MEGKCNKKGCIYSHDMRRVCRNREECNFILLHQKNHLHEESYLFSEITRMPLPKFHGEYFLTIISYQQSSVSAYGNESFNFSFILLDVSYCLSNPYKNVLSCIFLRHRTGLPYLIYHLLQSKQQLCQ